MPGDTSPDVQRKSTVNLVRSSHPWTEADSAAGFVLRYLAPMRRQLTSALGSTEQADEALKLLLAHLVSVGFGEHTPGQIEAAVSLGLKSWTVTCLVVLPQALRHVVPSLIGRCVALFKDTSLVIIVGLLDFLGMIKASAQDPEWLGYDAEAYVFCALIYWIICFSMSQYGKSIERRNQW